MQETLPPPVTSVWPRRAISAPTSAASWRYRDGIASLEAQNTQTASELMVAASCAGVLLLAATHPLDDDVDNFVGLVADRHERQVELGDLALVQRAGLQPVEQALPVRRSPK